MINSSQGINSYVYQAFNTNWYTNNMGNLGIGGNQSIDTNQDLDSNQGFDFNLIIKKGIPQQQQQQQQQKQQQ